VLSELRRVLIRTEQVTQEKLKADTGVWIESFLTMTPRAETAQLNFPGAPGAQENPAPTAGPAPGSGGEGAWITLVCRAIDLQGVASDANTTLYYTLENELKASPLFDKDKTGSGIDYSRFHRHVQFQGARPVEASVEVIVCPGSNEICIS